MAIYDMAAGKPTTLVVGVVSGCNAGGLNCIRI